MKVIYNKNDVEDAIKTHLESQGMNLEKKVVTTERVKDLIHVNIEDASKAIFKDDDNDFLDKP